jgi:hypothetical protein
VTVAGQMRSINKNLTAALLTLMRSRRSASAVVASQALAAVPQKIGAIGQREAQFTDFEEVARLKAQAGLSSDSLENWYRLWRDNAAVSFAGTPLPMGWVLEADGRVVGYLGSIPLLYHYGPQRLLAATASGFVVEPGYRAFSVGLVSSFYRQEKVDLFLNTTAIESVGKLAQAFKAEALPQGDYDTVLFWVLDVRGFVDVVARKLGANGNAGTVGKALGALALRTEKALRRRHPRRPAGKFQVAGASVEEIGADFEEVWQRKLAGEPRLLADRDQANLRWHFSIPASQQVIRVLRCERQGRLAGYAIVRIETERETGLRRCLLADMLVEGDEPEVVESLVAAAYGYAKELGCHVFEVLGFPRNLRQVLLKWKPYSRKFPACPFYFKAKDRTLHGMLKNEDSWYACPFDGDTTLMP